MNIKSNTIVDYVTAANLQAHHHRVHDTASKLGRFILHFLEMLLAMMAGMPILYMLRNLIPASTGYSAAYGSGTILSDLAMGVFMTVPMVAWMMVRGHGRRHSVEMAIAMLAPVAASVVLRLLGAGAYLPWLGRASHLGMFLGMLIAMLYRRDHYTGKAGHSAHATHRSLH